MSTLHKTVYQYVGFFFFKLWITCMKFPQRSKLIPVPLCHSMNSRLLYFLNQSIIKRQFPVYDSSLPEYLWSNTTIHNLRLTYTLLSGGVIGFYFLQHTSFNSSETVALVWLRLAWMILITIFIRPCFFHAMKCLIPVYTGKVRGRQLPALIWHLYPLLFLLHKELGFVVVILTSW
jgi:hypothetical protein